MNEISLLEQLKKTNRLYAFISKVNSMILHMKDKDLLFQEACNIAVREGKFLMSWIGIADEKDHILKPVAWAGKEEGYLTSIPPISVDDIPSGRGPAGRAFREGKSYVAKDFANNPNLNLWRNEGVKRGYASSIGIPIKIKNKSIGTFSIYSSEVDFFNETEVNQLEALTNNMSFALETIDNEKLRIEAETQLKKQTDELAQLHERYVSFTENMKEGLTLIGFDYRYLFLNPSAIYQSRVPAEKIIGHTIMECYPGVEKTLLFSRIRESMEKRIAVTIEDEFRYFPDGSKIWFELRLSPVPEGILMLSLDITDRKKVEDALLQSNKDRADELLLNASKMSALGEMASGIAHEINNPLSIIVMQAGNLQRRYINHEIENGSVIEGLTKITSTAQRIGKVVKGLSAISRNSENDPMKEISIATIIEDTIQLCLERFNSHGIQLKLDIELTNEATIMGRSPQIMQVLLNLLNNAFDAAIAQPQKWIEIKAFQTNSLAIIKIIDSGQGISEEILSKIMQPFFTTKDPGKGTGLGLSISKGIIDSHRGKLYYDKNVSHTCFVIELPLIS